MKIVLNLSSSEILKNSDECDRRDLYENLEEEFREDVEDLVDQATSMEKRKIFDSLMDDGYGHNLIPDNDEIPGSIESKRYMMDKSDDNMLMYLI